MKSHLEHSDTLLNELASVIIKEAQGLSPEELEEMIHQRTGKQLQELLGE